MSWGGLWLKIMDTFYDILNNFVVVFVFGGSKTPRNGLRDFCHAYTWLVSKGLQTF